MRARTQRKREVFSEAEAAYEVGHAEYSDIRKAWIRTLAEAHCSRCSVLILVPWDRTEERYRFEDRSWAHELACPNA